MTSFEKIKLTLKNPLWIIVMMNNRGLHLLNDAAYVKLLYKLKLKKKLNLDRPKLYNEKLQWLKLYDRKEIYTTMVDKYEAKQYVAKKIGKKYIIPTLGVYDRFDDIDFSTLPNQFVIKCTHDSGGLVICRDKNTFNKEVARKKINKCLKKNFFWSNREWPYRNVVPRIIIEKYMEDGVSKELRDYKFFCFNNRIGIVLVGTNRQKGLEETWFDEDFRMINLKEGGHKNRKDLKKPCSFDEMKEIAKKLSKGMPHVRVDLYEINGKVYFGELTFSPAGGFERFDDEEWNKKLGDLIDLSLVKK